LKNRHNQRFKTGDRYQAATRLADPSIMFSVGGSEIRSAAEGAALHRGFGSVLQAACQQLVNYRCGQAPVLNRLSPEAWLTPSLRNTFMVNFTVQS